MTDELAALLVCPLTRTPLRWDKEKNRLVSDEAALFYPIRGGTPVLLAEEAKGLGGEEAS